MRTVTLHDTASRELATLTPRIKGQVGIYVCGPTVYNRVHIGNARPFVTYALLARFLRQEGYEVTLVSNLTDVNDKIYDAAQAQGISSSQLASEMSAHYRADTDLLELGRPDLEPLVTESVPEIVELISALVERGAAYEAGGDVYFRVRRDTKYGMLSRRELDQVDQGEGDDASSLKEDPLDFALWKATKDGEDTSWESPWGLGRPGWHIECSAMAEATLGLGFEIHGGGSDLVFPHHENEAAQTRCARRHELSQIWMHSGMLQLDGEKMSKSIGNIAPLNTAVAEVGRDAIILLFCSAHYRQPLAYSADTIAQAQANVRRLRELGRRLSDGPSPSNLSHLKEGFLDALAADFNTPVALSHLWNWVREANRLADSSGESIGGQDLREMLDVFALSGLLDESTAGGPDAAALKLLERRNEARAAKDWALSDALRDELAAAGWIVRDGADGATLTASEG